MSKTTAQILQKIYDTLFQRFGPQGWWPGHSRCEIIVGAILTQNTNWTNVEKAISNLKANKLLSVAALKKVPVKKLASLIKSAGYYNIKAKRLKNFINFLFENYRGDLNKLSKESLATLRPRLLSVNGIGPETADSILLYALDKPIFVIDAYTRRILGRHGIIKQEADYASVQDLFMHALPGNVKLFNEYHALLVRSAKDFCRSAASCKNCPLHEKKFYPWGDMFSKQSLYKGIFRRYNKPTK